MKKQIILLILIFVSVCFLNPTKIFCQNNFNDVVYLKNGNVIHGIIIELVPEVSVKMKCIDDKIYIFKMDDVDKIAKETQIAFSFPKNKLSFDSVKQKGFTLIPELSFSGMNFSGDDFYGSVGINLVAGYLFNPHIYVGGGMGMEYNTSALYVPFFVVFRYNMLRKFVSPYLTAEGGYGWVAKGGYLNYEGGLRLKGGVGIRCFITRRIALNFALGLKFQKFSYKYDYAWWLPSPDCYHYTISGVYKILDISMGITF